jgi:hypothetical protein
MNLKAFLITIFVALVSSNPVQNPPADLTGGVEAGF